MSFHKRHVYEGHCAAHPHTQNIGRHRVNLRNQDTRLFGLNPQNSKILVCGLGVAARASVQLRIVSTEQAARGSMPTRDTCVAAMASLGGPKEHPEFPLSPTRVVRIQAQC